MGVNIPEYSTTLEALTIFFQALYRCCGYFLVWSRSKIILEHSMTKETLSSHHLVISYQGFNVVSFLLHGVNAILTVIDVGVSASPYRFPPSHITAFDISEFEHICVCVNVPQTRSCVPAFDFSSSVFNMDHYPCLRKDRQRPFG